MLSCREVLGASGCSVSASVLGFARMFAHAVWDDCRNALVILLRSWIYSHGRFWILWRYVDRKMGEISGARNVSAAAQPYLGDRTSGDVFQRVSTDSFVARTSRGPRYDVRCHVRRWCRHGIPIARRSRSGYSYLGLKKERGEHILTDD